MIEFFESHPGLFLCIVGIVVDIVLTSLVLIFRKKIKSSDFVEHIIDSCLPGFICLAEATGADGDSKLSMVLDLVMKKIRKYILKKDEHYYRCLTIDKTEEILKTPQKKEI